MLELVLYAAWSLFLVWPVTFDMRDRVIGSGDGEFYAWLGWRLARLMEAGASPLHIPDVVYPEGYDVALGDGIGAYLVLGVVNLMTGPFVALNLTVALVFFANCLAGRRLARVAGATNRSVLIVTALALAASPAIVTRASVHFHFCFVFIAALVVAEAVLVVRGNPVRAVRTGALLAAAFYVSFYWLMTSLLAYGVMVAVVAIRDRRVRFVAGPVGVALALAVLLTLPATVARLQFVQREREAGSPSVWLVQENEKSTLDFSADLLAFWTPPEAARIHPPGAKALAAAFSGNEVESVVFPGALLVVALVSFAFVRSRLRLPVLAASVVVWLLSLGPTLHVGGHLMHDRDGGPLRVLPARLLLALPGLDSLRTPSRLALSLSALCCVALAVVGQCALERISSRSARAALAVAAVLLLALGLVSNVSSPRHLAPEFESALRHIQATAAPGDAVAEVPFDAIGTVGTARFQLVHRRPMVGFHGQYAAIPWFSDIVAYKRSRGLAQLRCEPQRLGFARVPYSRDLRPAGDEMEDVQALRVRYLLVDERRLRAPVCDLRRASIESLLAPMHVIGRSRDWRVLEIPAPS